MLAATGKEDRGTEERVGRPRKESRTSSLGVKTQIHTLTEFYLSLFIILFTYESGSINY